MLKDYYDAVPGSTELIEDTTWTKQSSGMWMSTRGQCVSDLKLFMASIVANARQEEALAIANRPAMEARALELGLRVCLYSWIYDRDVKLLCDDYSGWVYGAEDKPPYSCGEGRYVVHSINDGVTCPECLEKFKLKEEFNRS